MITKNELMEQLLNNPFKKMLFATYNLIEDEGFVIEVSNQDKKSYDMDDFEYCQFALDVDDKKAIKAKKVDILNVFNDFKYEVEKILQPKFAYCRIYVMKDIGVVIAVKVKNFDIKKLLSN